MTNDEVLLELRSLITEINGIDSSLIINNSKIVELQIDSLDFFDVIDSLERKFNISISNSIASRVNTVGDLIDYIIELRTNK